LEKVLTKQKAFKEKNFKTALEQTLLEIDADLKEMDYAI